MNWHMRSSEGDGRNVITTGLRVIVWAIALCALGLVVLLALHWFNVLRVLGFGALGAEDRAWECLEAGDLAGAKSWLDKAISRAPEWYEPYELRGEVHERMGLYHKAIEDYTTAARLSAPYSANALALRGRVYEKLGNRDAAALDYAAALLADYKSPAPAVGPRAAEHIAQVRTESKPEQAILELARFLKEAMRRHPEEPTLREAYELLHLRAFGARAVPLTPQLTAPAGGLRSSRVGQAVLCLTHPNPEGGQRD